MSEPMRLRVRLAAPTETVWSALTDATALRAWLAEHAEVNLPERYEFWGRYTIEGDKPRQRLVHAQDHTLRFDWLDTTVEISLAGQDGETILSLSQTNLPGWDVLLETSDPRGLMHTYWALVFENLADYVEGRPITGLVDYTSPDTRVEMLIGASPADVFDSLVDQDKFSKWFGARMEMEPYVGGRWSMGGFEDNPEPAKVTEFSAGSKLAIQWPDGTVATWELEDSAGKTRLTFVQSGFQSDGRPDYGSWAGWVSGFAELRRYHENPDWRQIWLEVSVTGMPDGMLTI